MKHQTLLFHYVPFKDDGNHINENGRNNTFLRKTNNKKSMEKTKKNPTQKKTTISKLRKLQFQNYNFKTNKHKKQFKLS